MCATQVLRNPMEVLYETYCRTWSQGANGQIDSLLKLIKSGSRTRPDSRRHNVLASACQVIAVLRYWSSSACVTQDPEDRFRHRKHRAKRNVASTEAIQAPKENGPPINCPLPPKNLENSNINPKSKATPPKNLIRNRTKWNNGTGWFSENINSSTNLKQGWQRARKDETA